MWTIVATNASGEIDLLHHSLKRIFENCSEIQDDQDVHNLSQVGPSVMRMFHYLDLPMKALKVSVSIRIFIF